MGWKDALVGAKSRRPDAVFAAYGQLDDVALRARNQTAEGYRLLQINGSHPWLSDGQTQAYFYSSWMLAAFVRAAQASVSVFSADGAANADAIAFVQTFYDQASAWAGYWQVIPNSDRNKVWVPQLYQFQLAPSQLTSSETIRMAVTAAESLHGSAVEAMVDLGAQENLPPEWRRQLSGLQERIQQAGRDLDNLTPFAAVRGRGGAVPPHLAPAAIQLMVALLLLGQQLNQPVTLEPSIVAKTPVNLFQLDSQPTTPSGSGTTRYASSDHAGVASTARTLGFDVWRLVAPEQRQRRSSQREDVRELDRLMLLADPATDGPAIKRILDEIDTAAAVGSGTLVRSPQEALINLPWSPVHIATATTILGGERFSRGEKLAYTVKLEKDRFVHTFERLGFDPALTPARPTNHSQPRAAHVEQPPANGRPAAPPTRSASGRAPDSDALWRYSAPLARRRWGDDDAQVKLLTELTAHAERSSQGDKLRRFQDDIEAALQQRRIEHRPNEYQQRACPWAPVYVAREPVMLLGRQWQPGDAFFLYIGVDHGTVTVSGQSDGRRQL